MIGSLVMTLAAALPAPVAAGEGWIGDWDVAAKAAKEAGKDLLVDFTGSDWCGWCIRLDEEVFAHAAWKSAIVADYVLCALDFPNGDEAKAKVPNAARNEELREKYGVNGFPSILLMTADGAVYAKTGYQEGGPEAYLKHLAELRADGRPKLEQIAALEQQVAAAKDAAALGKALDVVLARLEATSADSPFAARLATLAKQALAEGGDAARRLRALKAIYAAGQADAALNDAARAIDPKNEHGLLERVVLAEMGMLDSPEKVPPFAKKIDELDAMGPLKDMKVAFELFMNAAFFNVRFLKDPAAALKYAGKVKATGQPIPPRAQQMLDQIEKDAAAGAGAGGEKGGGKGGG
ncbi:MAG: thioredoxin family protein [Planctomycetes bacterium]|nr:thioredoxin family protein [Planctomycetota bacterium]